MFSDPTNLHPSLDHFPSQIRNIFCGTVLCTLYRFITIPPSLYIYTVTLRSLVLRCLYPLVAFNFVESKNYLILMSIYCTLPHFPVILCAALCTNFRTNFKSYCFTNFWTNPYFYTSKCTLFWNQKYIHDINICYLFQ